MTQLLKFYGCVAALALLASGAGATEQAAPLGPQELVTKVAQDTLKDLDAHRAEYQKDPKKVRELVDKNMLPHFDTKYAAQLVLGKHWRTANAQQRDRFVEAFYQSLLQNYGEALLEFTPIGCGSCPSRASPTIRWRPYAARYVATMARAFPSIIRCARRPTAGKRMTCRSKACRT